MISVRHAAQCLAPAGNPYMSLPSSERARTPFSLYLYGPSPRVLSAERLTVRVFSHICHTKMGLPGSGVDTSYSEQQWYNDKSDPDLG